MNNSITSNNLKKIGFFLAVIIFSSVLILFFNSCNLGLKPYLRVALLDDNINLNYIDEPNFLTMNILNLVCPSLFYYDDNYLPKSKILKDIPSLDNKKMYSIKNNDSLKSAIIISKEDFKSDVNLINLNDILQTPSLFSIELLSKKWIYKQNFVINKMTIFQDSLNIEYNDSYSLPYFPYPTILISKYLPNYQQQIMDFIYKDKVNFDFLRPYSSNLKDSEFYKLVSIKSLEYKNIFTIYNQKNNRLIEFIGFKDYENLSKEISKLDLIKLDPKLVNLIKVPQDFQVKILPNQNVFFIFFNPNLTIENRKSIYYALRKNILNKLLINYSVYSYYLLYNHFALYDTDKVIKSEQSFKYKLSKKEVKGIIIYRNFSEKIIANLITEVLKDKFNFSETLFNLEQEDSGFSLENYFNLDKYDFIIISINLKPYFNYSKIYSSNGVYNFYRFNIDDDLVNKIMAGYSYDQKQYLIDLQEKLIQTFYVVPILVDTKAYIFSPKFTKKSKLLSSDYLEIL